MKPRPKSMHLLVDISAHGLGHLAQTAPVIDALQSLAPGLLRLTVRSALPRHRLARRIVADHAHVMEARDFGIVMHSAVDVDLVASARQYRQFHFDWPQRVVAEAEWLRHHRVDAVLSNVAYLPLAAAAHAGIPAVGLCSLNWADLFAHYFGGQSWAGEIHSQILAAYNAAQGFLRATPGLPMAGLIHRHDVAPIARIGRRDRTRLARLLDIEEDQRWVLLGMGGMEFPLPIEDWPRTPGLVWLVPGEQYVARDDVRNFAVAELNFSDLLAGVDVVVTKPGYGTFVEAACAGIPILYLERNDWPETPHFESWLAQHARARVLSRQRLLAGDFIDELQRLWQIPAQQPPQANGADQAARWLVKEFGLG